MTKNSNCGGILSDQGETATASNFSVYTILFSLLEKKCEHFIVVDFVEIRCF